MIINGFPDSVPKAAYGEIDLTQFKRAVTVSDSNGIPTTITFSRSDNSLFMKRIYSNPITATLNNGLYRTCVEQFYGLDGSAVLATYTYTFTYTSVGLLNTEERVVG